MLESDSKDVNIENEAVIEPASLWEYLESQCKALSLELYDLEQSGAGRMRVFVDKPNYTGENDSVKKRGSGVTSDDCSNLCRKLVHGFAVYGPKLGVGSEPEVEVSSPGIERVLRSVKHFEGAVGEKVKITSKTGFNNGVLIGFDGITLVLKSGEKEIEVAMSDIKKAQVEY
jgi:ribosome maturation factor RimP